MEDMSERVAVVSGGHRGIGLGITNALLEDGMRVAVLGRDQRTLDGIAATTGAMAVRCDVRDRAAVAEVMEAVVRRYGRLDVAVANAGRPSEQRAALEVEPRDWDDIIATNLTGVFSVAQLAARHMVTLGRGGSIVLVSSIRAVAGAPYGVAYSAAKAGVEGLGRALAVSLAPHRIQVNVVRPGWIATEAAAALSDDRALSEAILGAVPAGAWGRPADVAEAVRYLVSPRAGFHTGDVLTVDGGYLSGDPRDPILLAREAQRRPTAGGGSTG